MKDLRFALRRCGPSLRSSIGALMPGQNSFPDITLTKGAENEELPMDAHSTLVGFSIATATDPAYWASILGPGRKIDLGMKDKPPSDNLEYWQMVRAHQDCISPSPEVIQAMAASFTGQVYLIGNEPDVIWQDDITATRYDIISHELYTDIKSTDPATWMATGGISQATTLLLQYLDQVLKRNEYIYHQKLPADWWTVHGQVLREEKDTWDIDISPGMETTKEELFEVSDHNRLEHFKSQHIAFLQWMFEHGYQNTFLVLSESSILIPISYGFSMGSIARLLEQAYTWLYKAQYVSTGYPGDDLNLVQIWTWISLA